MFVCSGVANINDELPRKKKKRVRWLTWSKIAISLSHIAATATAKLTDETAVAQVAGEKLPISTAVAS